MKILIADKFEEQGMDALRAHGHDVIARPGLQGLVLAEAVHNAHCDVLVVRSNRVTKEILAASPQLKLVIRAGSGFDTIDVPEATKRNIRVCNCPGMNSVAVAELTIGLMVALDRRIVEETDDLRRGIWNKKEYSKARGLKGRTLGIVGMGRIGYEVARRAKAFDMEIIFHDVVPHPEIEKELGAHKVPFEKLLRDSDFLTLHVPGGGATMHLIGAEELDQMKPTAFLLNCARGGVVDETALAGALEDGKLAGAALDVYEVEPALPAGPFADPIGRVTHVYGTHHVGASTEQAQLAVADEVVHIVDAFAKRGEYMHCVNAPKFEFSST